MSSDVLRQAIVTGLLVFLYASPRAGGETLPFGQPGFRALGVDISEDTGGWNVSAAVTMTCPDGQSIQSLSYNLQRSGDPRKPAVPERLEPLDNIGINEHTLNMSFRVDGSATCDQERRLHYGLILQATCQSESSKTIHHFGKGSINFTAKCDGDTIGGLHDPTIRVDDGGEPDIKPTNSAGIYTSYDIDPGDKFDIEPAIGIRLALGLKRSFSLELGASLASFELSDSPGLRGDLATIDLHLSHEFPVHDRFRLNAFAGPGLRLAHLENEADSLVENREQIVPASSLSLSGGLGLEWLIANRWSIELRLVERWLEDPSYEEWSTEGQLGISYHLVGRD